jgi:hypothetical protein
LNGFAFADIQLHQRRAWYGCNCAHFQPRREMADPLLNFGGGFGVFQFLKDGLWNQNLTKKGGQQIHFVN